VQSDGPQRRWATGGLKRLSPQVTGNRGVSSVLGARGQSYWSAGVTSNVTRNGVDRSGSCGTRPLKAWGESAVDGQVAADEGLIIPGSWVRVPPAPQTP